MLSVVSYVQIGFQSSSLVKSALRMATTLHSKDPKSEKAPIKCSFFFNISVIYHYEHFLSTSFVSLICALCV